MWGWAGTDATPAALNLGLCRLRGILSPPSATTTFRRRAISTIRNDGAAGGPFYLRARRCRRNCSSLLPRLLQAELIYFATTKIRIGRGNVAATTSQAGHSFLRHDGAATILDFRPRIGNHCSTTGHFGDFRAAILDFKPRIENRCSQKSKQGQSAHRFSI